MYYWEWEFRKHRCCQQIMQISARGIVATIAESAAQNGNQILFILLKLLQSRDCVCLFII